MSIKARSTPGNFYTRPGIVRSFRRWYFKEVACSHPFVKWPCACPTICVTKENDRKRTEVLVVEDNAADRFWLEYVLQSTGVKCALSVVSDGEQALDFLLKRGEYIDAPTPNVIFIDAHLPKRDGIDILRELPDAGRLPICIVTSSEADRKSFREEFGIDDSNYMLKPLDHASLTGSSCCRENLGLDSDHTDSKDYELD